MEIKVEANYIRVAPRKVKLIADAVRSLPLNRVIEELRLINKAGARPLLDALVSGRANAVNNLKLNAESLTIKSIEVNGGPALKRWMPVSRGMAHGYKKRMSHIRVVLTEKEEKNGSKSKS